MSQVRSARNINKNKGGFFMAIDIETSRQNFIRMAESEKIDDEQDGENNDD
jgi:hypothetical protein